ncbi:MAG: hypothetical protein N4A48_10440 [Tepidibacter sp.]|jgi:phosphate-selective porin|uniref:hypothetical protein n=1 Tax=Tepidibacter sp. TaxID=2529387 RepID=UPI0025F371FB|nr:hypothetical protein [Tepidibacter sp.]MCT4509151.1 hypothetical protein [Tepidibacter sp.]
MEGILIPAIIYVLSIVFKSLVKEDEDDKNTENKKEGSLLKTVNNTVKKIETNLNELSNNYKKQKHIEGSKVKYKDKKVEKNIDQGISDIVVEDIEIKQDSRELHYDIDQKENINTEYNKSMDSDEAFNLFSDADDLMKGIIMSEILSKPKSMRR